jgi:DNA-binding SARP family transcriptional activator
MEFVLLGGIAVLDGGGALDLGPARQRCVLVAPAVGAGRVVSVDRLIDRVWGQSPPLRARATLLNYLSRLRLLLADADTGAVTVARRPGGYTLQADRSAVDVLRFHDLCDRARAVDDGQAVALLRQALELWRGEALAGVDRARVETERDRLHQRRLNAECDLTDVLLRLGHGEDLVTTLATRAAQWPLDERVAGQLVLALHQRILDTDPALTPPPAAISGGTAAKAEQPVPRQLPAPPRWFTGRGTELARLDQSLTTEPEEDPLRSETSSGTPAGATVMISAIGGAGGIGKTWLALTWAHQHAEQFPDGQLFVDLHGFSPTQEPTAPGAAVRRFLDALGVDPDRIPTDLAAQAALYREQGRDEDAARVQQQLADLALATEPIRQSDETDHGDITVRH